MATGLRVVPSIRALPATCTGKWQVSCETKVGAHRVGAFSSISTTAVECKVCKVVDVCFPRDTKLELNYIPPPAIVTAVARPPPAPIASAAAATVVPAKSIPPPPRVAAKSAARVTAVHDICYIFTIQYQRGDGEQKQVASVTWVPSTLFGDDDYRICYRESNNALNRIVIVLPIHGAPYAWGDAVLQLDIKSAMATLPPPRFTHVTPHNPIVRIVFPATITTDHGLAGSRMITAGIGKHMPWKIEKQYALRVTLHHMPLMFETNNNRKPKYADQIVGGLGWCHPQRDHLAPEPFINPNQLKMHYDPRFGTIIMFHVLSVVAVKPPIVNPHEMLPHCTFSIYATELFRHAGSTLGVVGRLRNFIDDGLDAALARFGTYVLLGPARYGKTELPICVSTKPGRLAPGLGPGLGPGSGGSGGGGGGHGTGIGQGRACACESKNMSSPAVPVGLAAQLQPIMACACGMRPQSVDSAIDNNGDSKRSSSSSSAAVATVSMAQTLVAVGLNDPSAIPIDSDGQLDSDLLASMQALLLDTQANQAADAAAAGAARSAAPLFDADTKFVNVGLPSNSNGNAGYIMSSGQSIGSANEVAAIRVRVADAVSSSSSARSGSGQQAAGAGAALASPLLPSEVIDGSKEIKDMSDTDDHASIDIDANGSAGCNDAGAAAAVGGAPPKGSMLSCDKCQCDCYGSIGRFAAPTTADSGTGGANDAPPLDDNTGGIPAPPPLDGHGGSPPPPPAPPLDAYGDAPPPPPPPLDGYGDIPPPPPPAPSFSSSSSSSTSGGAAWNKKTVTRALHEVDPTVQPFAGGTRGWMDGTAADCHMHAPSEIAIALRNGREDSKEAAPIYVLEQPSRLRRIVAASITSIGGICCCCTCGANSSRNCVDGSATTCTLLDAHAIQPDTRGGLLFFDRRPAAAAVMAMERKDTSVHSVQGQLLIRHVSKDASVTTLYECIDEMAMHFKDAPEVMASFFAIPSTDPAVDDQGNLNDSVTAADVNQRGVWLIRLPTNDDVLLYPVPRHRHMHAYRRRLDGAIFVADGVNSSRSCVWRITPGALPRAPAAEAIVTRVMTTTQFASRVTGIVCEERADIDAVLYVADYTSGVIHRSDASGTGAYAEGRQLSPISVPMANVNGVALQSLRGRMLVVDTLNHCIAAITSLPTISRASVDTVDAADGAHEALKQLPAKIPVRAAGKKGATKESKENGSVARAPWETHDRTMKLMTANAIGSERLFGMLTILNDMTYARSVDGQWDALLGALPSDDERNYVLRLWGDANPIIPEVPTVPMATSGRPPVNVPLLFMQLMRIPRVTQRIQTIQARVEYDAQAATSLAALQHACERVQTLSRAFTSRDGVMYQVIEQTRRVLKGLPGIMSEPPFKALMASDFWTVKGAQKQVGLLVVERMCADRVAEQLKRKRGDYVSIFHEYSHQVNNIPLFDPPDALLPVEENLVQIRGEVKAYERARLAALSPSTPPPVELAETLREKLAWTKRTKKETKKVAPGTVPEYQGPLVTLGQFTANWMAFEKADDKYNFVTCMDRYVKESYDARHALDKVVLHFQDLYSDLCDYCPGETSSDSNVDSLNDILNCTKEFTRKFMEQERAYYLLMKKGGIASAPAKK